jgi:hypothetical protein
MAKPPSSGFATFSPRKARGEKALDVRASLNARSAKAFDFKASLDA